ncbi:hypothetical protein LXL04_011720 [Taraxacum kok-saghyz]
MASSSSSVGNRNRGNFRRPPLRERCLCDDPVGKWTGWRSNNPGWRFIGCPNFRDVDKNCEYFAWVDPELPNQWYKDLLMDFHNNDYVGNGGFEEFVEHPGSHVVAAAVQGQAKLGEGGFEGGKWKIGFWVCVIIIVWLLCN